MIKNGYAAIEYEYDSNGYRVAYRYFDTEDLPVMNAEGYFEQRNTNDDAGRVLSEVNYDEAGQIITLANYTSIQDSVMTIQGTSSHGAIVTRIISLS